jgi:actin-related protein
MSLQSLNCFLSYHSLLSSDDQAIIIDIGSETSRIGFSGQDRPAFCKPTSYFINNQRTSSVPIFNLNTLSGDELVKSPLVDGLVQDWDALETLYTLAFHDILGLPFSNDQKNVDLHQHPVLISEHLYTSKADREKMCELMFEKFNAPGIFMSKAGVLSLYSNAKTTGLVVDMGANGTQITPVQDGYVLMMGARVNPLGGDGLNSELFELMDVSSKNAIKECISNKYQKKTNISASLFV